MCKNLHHVQCEKAGGVFCRELVGTESGLAQSNAQTLRQFVSQTRARDGQ